MKKKYIEPTLLITYVEPQRMICTSILGVTGTGHMETTVGDDETDVYLARRNHDVWDAEEDGDQEW